MSSFYKGFLLLAVLLGSAATLDEDEGLEKWEAVSLVATRFGKDTADGVPEMPKNFRVSPESSSLVMATWDRPASGADVDHYIVSEDSNGKQDTTSYFYYLWEDLEACTKYAFSLRAVTSTGDTSEPAQGEAQTLFGTPPEPRDLHVEEYTYDTVTLAWEHPDTPCDIDHYRVKYSEGESTPLDALASETTLTVTDLLPDTAYTFSVYASTLEGEGTAATVEQNTTDPVGPPEDLVAEGISSSAINVSWSAPFEKPSYYEVTAFPCMYSTADVYDLMYVIEDENLKPCQRCFITVTSIYRGGRKFSASISGEPDFDAPPPPKNCHVEVQKEYLAASWERPTAECALGIYNVMWTSKKLWGNLEEESDSINTTGLSHTVYNPSPYHEYTFHIAASIKGIFGSPTACSNTSLESPAGPPVNVSTASQEHGEVRVTWESPEEENGEILKYGIFTNDASNSSKEVSGDVHSATINVEPCHIVGIWVAARNHAVWGEQSNVTNITVLGDVLPEELNCTMPEPGVQVCWKPFSRDCPGTQYNLKWEGDVLWSDTLTDMNDTTLAWSEEEICYIIPSTPYTTYTVELSVGKKSDATITCLSTTPMAAPGQPSLEELQTDELAINVTWKEPVEKNGVISAYQVKWVDWIGEHTYNTPDANTFSHQIMEPSCGGEVAVTVRANTTEVEDFIGKESQPRSVFRVNSVRNLTCKATEPGVVGLTWEVTDSQCPVDSFNVTWTFASIWSEDKGSSFMNVGGEDTSASVEPLLPYSKVSVEIHVDNAPQNTLCTVTTQEEESDPPGDVHQIANDTNSVTVTWSRPEAVRGKLAGWYLKWTLSDEFIDDFDINDPANKTFWISELSSSETYRVCVMAKNGKGRGKEGCASVTTANALLPSTSDPLTSDPWTSDPLTSDPWTSDPLTSDPWTSDPESPLGLILGLSIGGGVLLILLAVGGYALYAKKTKTRPPRYAPFMPDVIDLDKDNLYNKQHQSAASQRFQGKNGTVDFGTNKELYHDNDKARRSLEEIVSDDMIHNGNSTVPGTKSNFFEVSGDRRLSQQVSNSLPKRSAYNRRPSQVVNMGMRTFEEYNRRSSQPAITAISERGMHSRPSFPHEDVVKPNLGEFGRRPSQFIDIGRPNLKEFGRRPSQQIDIRRPNPMQQYGNRSSQQMNQGRPRLVEYGRRPSQQADLGRPNMKEYGRRPSQQIDLGRTRAQEFARRPSHQIDVGGMSVPSRPPQQPGPAGHGYDHYRRRPTQQADIGMPIDRAVMKRPSQQFMMNFDGIKE